MRHVLTVLAVSATCSLAAASNFSIQNGNNQGFGIGQPGTLPSIQTDNVTIDSVGTASIPAPGTSMLALVGLAALGRRRRTK